MPSACIAQYSSHMPRIHKCNSKYFNVANSDGEIIKYYQLYHALYILTNQTGQKALPPLPYHSSSQLCQNNQTASSSTIPHIHTDGRCVGGYLWSWKELELGLD